MNRAGVRLIRDVRLGTQELQMSDHERIIETG